MKILFVIDSLGKGGIERRMLELTKTLCKLYNSEIYLISLDSRVEYDYIYTLPIRFEILKRKRKKDLSLYWKLLKRVNEFEPNIVHSWGSMSSIFIAPIAKLMRIKFVNGYIGQAPSKVTLKDEFYLRGLLTFPLSDAIVSNSHAGLKSYRAPKRKSYCIYNGIDLKRFENLTPSSDIKNELFGKVHDDSFIVAMLAAFEERKDYDTYIDVAVELCKSNDSIKFLCIGGGKKFELIKSKVPNQYLNKKIFFLGKRSDIESLLQIIDVGILLTNSKVHGEGVSNAIIEYMASSKPVIATKGGGTDEVIVNNVNGFLVDFKAADQVLLKVLTLINNPSLATDMGKAGNKIVHEKFDIQKMSEKYMNLYTSLINGK